MTGKVLYHRSLNLNNSPVYSALDQRERKANVIEGLGTGKHSG